MFLLKKDSEKSIQCCAQCGAPLTVGRVDRRFCSMECKNRWHNSQRFPNREKEVKRVLRILENNRKVLDRLLKLDMHSVDRPTLLHLGFNLNYFTTFEKVSHRLVYSCLDIAYEVTPTRIKGIHPLCELQGI